MKQPTEGLRGMLFEKPLQLYTKSKAITGFLGTRAGFGKMYSGGHRLGSL